MREGGRGHDGEADDTRVCLAACLRARRDETRQRLGGDDCLANCEYTAMLYACMRVHGARGRTCGRGLPPRRFRQKGQTFPVRRHCQLSIVDAIGNGVGCMRVAVARCGRKNRKLANLFVVLYGLLVALELL